MGWTGPIEIASHPIDGGALPMQPTARNRLSPLIPSTLGEAPRKCDDDGNSSIHKDLPILGGLGSGSNAESPAGRPGLPSGYTQGMNIGPLMLATLAALLVFFVAGVALITVTRARRRAGQRTERKQPTPPDPWAEAGRRARAYPRHKE